MARREQTENTEFSTFIIRTIDGSWVCNVSYKEEITSSDLMRAKLSKDWDPKKYVVATEKKVPVAMTAL